MNGLKVLVSGDLHIGRNEKVAEAGEKGVAASEAWGRIVDVAIQEKVLVVCLTGDVADDHNKFTEARSVLEKGLRLLGDNGIKTVAVSGNHDFGVLSRLNDSFPDEVFQLLGSEHKWERVNIYNPDSGRIVLSIDGWSYLERFVSNQQPIESYDFLREGDWPVLAMIHGELNNRDTKYAFLPRESMLQKPVDGWLLGHKHRRALVETPGSPFIIYPGSPQALHANEKGIHGVEIINLDQTIKSQFRQVPISTVRYVGPDEFQIDLTSFDQNIERTDPNNYVLDKIRDKVEKVKIESGEFLKYVVLRLLLSGQTDLANDIKALNGLLSELVETRESSLDFQGVYCSIDKVDCTVLPKIDLYEESKRKGPIGLVALALIELEEKPTSEYSPSTRKLFDKAKGDIETYRKKYNHTIHDETDDDNASDEILDHELKTSIRTQLSAVLLTHRSRGQI